MPPSLRTLADHSHITLGSAIIAESTFLTDPTYQQLHAQYFNLLVPNNAMKCSTICAQPHH